jgi:cation diffusion facilitator CzcD-associated flavoprotein CzcO
VNWPDKLDLMGKTVGLIGNGFSGIQILPVIKEELCKLVTFVREATWVAPPMGGEFKANTEEDKIRFA